jgi:hypothetical protein
MLACGCKPPDESLEHAKQSLIPIEDDTSWVDKLATTIVKVPPAAMAADGPAAHNGGEKYRRMIINSVKRWTCEMFVESPDLIRDMFALLLRQYNGVTEVCLPCVTLFQTCTRADHAVSGEDVRHTRAQCPRRRRLHNILKSNPSLAQRAIRACRRGDTQRLSMVQPLNIINDEMLAGI